MATENSKELFTSFMQQLMVQQLKEFRAFLKLYKSKDDEIDKIYEAGLEPTEKQAREFARLKIEYEEFMQYFKLNDFNLFESKDYNWTPLVVAEELIKEVYSSSK